MFGANFGQPEHIHYDFDLQKPSLSKYVPQFGSLDSFTTQSGYTPQTKCPSRPRHFDILWQCLFEPTTLPHFLACRGSGPLGNVTG
jgi:hypothetical protein